MIHARGRALWLCLVVLLGVAACGLVYAQPPTAVPKTGEPRKLAPRDPNKPKKKSQVRVNHADKARYDSKLKFFYLWGHIEFQDEEMKLFCDEATYNEAEDTAACLGNLKVIDKESTINGNLINADFNAELVNIENAVKIVTTKTLKSKEKEEPEKRVTTITCDHIVYCYTEGKRNAQATGNLKAVQKDKTVVADRADYDREKDIIVLTPNVKITMDNGNEFECTKATISATEDWVDMEPMQGLFLRDNKKKTEEGKPPG